MNRSARFSISVFLLLCFPVFLSGQGFQTIFGKSVVQYRKFEWNFYRDKSFEVYYYGGGKMLAQYVLAFSHQYLENIEKIIDFRADRRITIIVYNSFSDFKQSNIPLQDEKYNTGGMTPIHGNVAFIWFNGDHHAFDIRIKAALAEVLINELLNGSALQEKIQNSAMLNLPDWYYKGLISYISGDWDPGKKEQLEDGILSGRFEKFSRLNDNERILIGHSLWEYIDKVYGSKSLQNILYITHLNKSIETGFSFVLGKSYKDIYSEWYAFYRYLLKSNDKTYTAVPSALPLPKKSTKGEITAVSLKPSGDKVAYVTNVNGKYSIWVFEISTGKLIRVFKRGYLKIDKDIDYAYPLIQWHPYKDVLTVIFEKKAEPWYFDINFDKGKKENKRKLDRVDQVLSFDYDDQGRRIVISAVREGKSDILIYEIRSNRYFPVTNDIFDDLDPHFVDHSRGIAFSSNRSEDTLSKNLNSLDYPFKKQTDIYYYDYVNARPVLQNLTNTPDINESSPMAFDSVYITYLTDGEGILSRDIVRRDSIFSFIMVKVNYKDTSRFQPDSFFFFSNTPGDLKIDTSNLKDTSVSYMDTIVVYRDTAYKYILTDYSRNVYDFSISPKRNKIAGLFRKNNRYFITIASLEDSAGVKLYTRNPGENMVQRFRLKQQKLNLEFFDTEDTLKNYTPLGIDRLISGTGDNDSFKYYFLSDFRLRSTDSAWLKTDIQSGNKNGDVSRSFTKESVKKLRFGTASPYFLSFSPDYLLTQFDNNFLNTAYLPYDNEGPIYPFNKVINLMFKLGVNDVFKDYRIAGGFRLPFNLNGTEYIFNIEDLKRRLDKKFIFYRKSEVYDDNYNRIRQLTNEARFQLKYPFNEYNCLKGEFFIRQDKKVTLSSEMLSLVAPDVTANWFGYKFEYVHDNAIPQGINLNIGSRYKLYFENYINFDNTNQKLMVFGGDFRKYIRVHRQIIWANRLAFAASFGNSKVVYFLGGVENWLLPSYNYFIQVDKEINYVYKSLATNMRGFDQNIRNGNSYAVFNSELRVPVFKYIYNRPLKSTFLENFQVVGFMDLGTAWTGSNPYSKENMLNKRIIYNGPFKIIVTNVGEPVVGGGGLGVRAYFLGYFIKLDRAWGFEAGNVISKVTYLSFGLDF